MELSICYIILLIFTPLNGFEFFPNSKTNLLHKNINKFTHHNNLRSQSSVCVSKYFKNYINEAKLDSAFILLNSTSAANSIMDNILYTFNRNEIGSLMTMTNGQLHTANRLMNVIDVITNLRDIHFDGLTQLKQLQINYKLIHIIYIDLSQPWLTEAQFIKQIRFVFRTFVTRFGVDIILAVQKPLSSGGGGYVWQFYQQINDNCKNNNALNIEIVQECAFSSNHTSFRTFKRSPPIRKCPLMVDIKKIAPFILHDKHKGFYGGIELLMLKTISEKLNITQIYSMAKNTNEGATVDYGDGKPIKLV